MSNGNINAVSAPRLSRRAFFRFRPSTPLDAATQRENARELRTRLESEGQLADEGSQARRNGERARAILVATAAMATDQTGRTMEAVNNQTEADQGAIDEELEKRLEPDLIQLVLDGLGNAGDKRCSRRDIVTSPVRGAKEVGLEAASCTPVVGFFVRAFRFITGR